MSTEKKKILLIKHRDFSYTDVGIYQQLVKQFPECEVSIFNVYDIHQRITLFHLWVNLFYFLWEYGFDYLLGYKKLSGFRGYFKGTSYFVSMYRKYVCAKIKSDDYFFVFQLQTIFNGATYGTPHFVYSDHITLANFHYPDVNPRQYARSKAIVKIEQSLCQSARCCFTMSTNIRDLIIKEFHVPESRVKCVYAGSNVEINQVPDEQKYLRKEILFIGVDWERKGGPTLVKAFEEVLKEIPDARLTIIGCSPKIKRHKNIDILGKLPLTELPGYYNRSTVFCFPTLREPFGLVIVEAMLHRLPIVTNEIGAMPDMVKHGVNGFLVKNEVSQYAHALIHLLNHPGLCKYMGDNSYDLARERYTWDKVGEKLRENIEQALSIG